jgi:hypothetical protein
MLLRRLSSARPVHGHHGLASDHRNQRGFGKALAPALARWRSASAGSGLAERWVETETTTRSRRRTEARPAGSGGRRRYICKLDPIYLFFLNESRSTAISFEEESNCISRVEANNTPHKQRTRTTHTTTHYTTTTREKSQQKPPQTVSLSPA